jgi:hypothetical protein
LADGSQPKTPSLTGGGHESGHSVDEKLTKTKGLRPFGVIAMLDPFRFAAALTGISDGANAIPPLD